MLRVKVVDETTDVLIGANLSNGKVIASDRYIGSGLYRDVYTIDAFPTVPLRGSEGIMEMGDTIHAGNMHLMVDELQKRIAYRQLSRCDRMGRKLLPQIGLIQSGGGID